MQAPPAAGRTVLFLQGPSSTLFSRIADGLEQRGIGSLRINLCTGDRIFWRRRGAINFRGRLSDWPTFLADVLERERISELVLLGEERPHHRVAVEAAERRGLPVIAVEMGYLRPDWISVEVGGSGSNSWFPNDPAHILEHGRDLPQPDMTVRYPYTFFQDASRDLLFNLPNVFLGFLHPHYRWHAIHHPLAEYLGWIRRLAAGPARRRTADAVMRKVAATPRYFVFPLQLETDYQIRVHSPFNTQFEALDLVVTSFAAQAPQDTHLVVKLHPLDNGLIDWRGHLQRRAETLGMGDRLHFLDGGDLGTLFAGAAGVVTINSSAGFEALRRGRPLKVLGVALYDVPGLVDREPLDRFWTGPVAPDGSLRDAFFALLAASIHVRGNFYDPGACAIAAASIAERIAEGHVNAPHGMAPVRPRRKPAKTGLPLS
jgi:capsular polysaccharide export protein